MKILLFNPPTADGKKYIREGRCTQEEGAWGTLWPPVSLATAAAALEQGGHEVCLRDFPAEGIGLPGLDALVSQFKPRVAIWSSGTPSITSDLAIAARVKGLSGGITTVTFGTHAATLAHEVLSEHPALDVIIRGEPELTVLDLVGALDVPEKMPHTPGLAFLNDRKELVVTEPREMPRNLDDLPDPAWHLLEVDRYRLPLNGRKFLMVVPTRGCPYACSFCTTHSYYGSVLRRRSVSRVVAEIQHNIEAYGVRDFLFWSDTFTLDKTYVKDLCRAFIDAHLDISWAANSRVDTAEPGMFKLMKQAGCWMVSYGIESASQTVMELTHKGASVSAAQEAVRWSKEAGLQVTGHFVLGLPGDDVASIETTIQFSLDLGLDFAQYYCAVPFPGSELYREAKEKGWLRPALWEDFRQDNALMHLPGLPPETVQKLRDKAYRKFYSHPRVWLSKIRMIRLSALPKLWATMKTVIGWRRT